MVSHPLSGTEDQDNARVHATCVAVAQAGLLIIGPSGSGKSGLALQMMALGARLVADDQVDLRMQDGVVMAETVAAIGCLIEARGIGLLRAGSTGPVAVHYVIDLGQPEPDRLPDHKTIPVLRQTVPLLHGAGVPNLAAALVQLLKEGRIDPQWSNT